MDIVLIILIIIAAIVLGTLGVIIGGVYYIGKMYADLEELVDLEDEGE